MDIDREAALTGLRDHDTQGANDPEQCGAVQSLNGGLTDESYVACCERPVAKLARQLGARSLLAKLKGCGKLIPSTALDDFVRLVFAELDLDWREHTTVSESLFRPTDISEGKGNASKAERVLGWKARSNMPDVISTMVKAELKEPERRRAA